MISSNFGAFYSDFIGNIKKSEKEQQHEAIRIVLYAHNHLISISPRNTGRYVASHVISFDTTSSKKAPDGLSPSQYEALALKESAYLAGTNIKDKKTIFIQNNLEYAEALEDGSSKQAATGIYSVVESNVKSRFKL